MQRKKVIAGVLLTVAAIMLLGYYRKRKAEADGTAKPTGGSTAAGSVLTAPVVTENSPVTPEQVTVTSDSPPDGTFILSDGPIPIPIFIPNAP